MFGFGKSVEKLQSTLNGNILQYRLPSEGDIDKNAMSAVGTRNDFCTGSIVRLGREVMYQFDLTGLYSVGRRPLNNYEVKSLFESLSTAMYYLTTVNGRIENLVLTPDRVFLNGRGCSFIYVPLKQKNPSKPEKVDENVIRFITDMQGISNLFGIFLNTPIEGDTIIDRLWNFAQGIWLPPEPQEPRRPTPPQAAAPQKPVTPPDDEDEGQTTILDASSDEEGEGETTILGTTAEEEGEGETTILGASSDADGEGETTILGAPSASEHTGKKPIAPPAAIAEPELGVSLIRVTNGEEIRIPPEGAVIGSAVKPGQVMIPNRSISRSHAQIIIVNGAVFIKDLGSTNGTSVDGIALIAGDRAQIFDGSFVTLGSESLHIRIK